MLIDCRKNGHLSSMGDGLVRWVLTGMSCCAVLGAPAQALACGGGFAEGPPTVPAGVETSFVAGHRMAFAVSDERTVLWSQLEVRSAPTGFSWVLPVRPGAFIEASRDAWFAALEAATATRVRSPNLECAGGSDESIGCGCMSGSVGGDVKGDSDGGAENNQVSVISASTFGPYETVTLASTDGDALTAWLIAHGYSVPEDIAPIISAYVSEGFDFIALRLKPGAQTAQVTPVRVVTPGRDTTLPLRLVAAGTGSSVPMTLYVIGEGRFRLGDLQEASLDLDELSWDFLTFQSNYRDVRRAALATAFGASFLTTFAQPGAFVARPTDADGIPIQFRVGSYAYASLAEAYFGQGAALPESCTSALAELQSDRLVTASGEGIAPGDLTCGEADDIAAAFTGMHPRSVWLTRLDLELPRSALTSDCVIEQVGATTVGNDLVARRFTHAPKACTQPVFESGVVGRTQRERALWLALFGFAALSRLRRRASA
jgi:hypothetical protein